MNRRGFSMIELMVVIVMVGIMMLIGYPKIQSQLGRSELRAAASRVSAVYAQGRANAIQTGRTTTLNMGSNALWLTVDAGGTLDTVGVVQYLDSLYKTTLTVSSGVTSLDIDARGIINPPLAADVELTVARDGYDKTITITRYGRIVKE